MLPLTTDRGSVLPVSEIGKLITAYQDKHGSSDRAIALRVGVSATMIGRWKRGAYVEVPKPATVRALIDLMVPLASEDEVIEAFLTDTGYRGEQVDDDHDHPPMTTDADIAARGKRGGEPPDGPQGDTDPL